MKIKNLAFLGLTLTLFVPQTYGKDDKSVIQRIEETEAIPVYLVLSEIDFDKFNSSSAGIALTFDENKINESKHTTKMASGDYNSLLPYIVQELNKDFNTTKFFAAPVEELPVTDKNLMDVNDPEAKLAVVVKIDAKYVYDYMLNKPKRNEDKELVTTMKYNGSFSYDFYLINSENASKKSIASNGGFVYGQGFEVTGIVSDVATLEGFNDLSVIINQFKDVIADRISKHAEKLYKKDAKK